MTDLSSCALGSGSILAGFCATELPLSLSKPRSIKVDKADSQRIFVLERGIESIVHLLDSDGDGIAETKEFVAAAEGLNHGLAIFDGYIYASSDTDVYRWSLYGEDNSLLEFPLTDREHVVTNMNADGNGGAPMGHKTRTIEFHESGDMYVSVGSNGNVDEDSHRSRIRRQKNMRDEGIAADFPIDFQAMEVFADGLRNEVGLAFDGHGMLWGVENSADNLARDDLGGDIHEDNPAEELNRFDPSDSVVRHFGYPYCWTEFNLPSPPGMGRGTVWTWPSFHEKYGGSVTDEECSNSEIYEPPVMAMQGHSAPLGITFFDWKSPEDRDASCEGVLSFPKAMNGYAFIAYHGSWNRDVPTGYKVVYVEMDEEGNPLETGSRQPIDLLAHKAPDAKWEDGFRPVDVAFDHCGRLLVTSDGTRGVGSKIVLIEYKGGGSFGTEEGEPSSLSSSSSSLPDSYQGFLSTLMILLVLVNSSV